MSGYVKLFSVEIEHMFFANGGHSAFRYVATPATAELIERRDLLLRLAENGIAIFSSSRLARECVNAGEACQILVFKIFSEDLYFTQYTLPMARDADVVPYFQSARSWPDGQGHWRLHEQHYVDADVLQKIHGTVLAPHLDGQDALMKPAAVVAILLYGGVAAGPRDYYLRFSTRKSLWKYYFVSEADANSFSIIDLDGEIRFERAEPENLPGNKRALVFLSDVEIEMRQKYAQRFQLREQNGLGEKVLIRRLPNASVNRVSLDRRGVLLSEIYIN